MLRSDERNFIFVGSFAGTCLSQLVGAGSFEGGASDSGKRFTSFAAPDFPSDSSAKSTASSSSEAYNLKR